VRAVNFSCHLGAASQERQTRRQLPPTLSDVEFALHHCPRPALQATLPIAAAIFWMSSWLRA